MPKVREEDTKKLLYQLEKCFFSGVIYKHLKYICESSLEDGRLTSAEEEYEQRLTENGVRGTMPRHCLILFCKEIRALLKRPNGGSAPSYEGLCDSTLRQFRRVGVPTISERLEKCIDESKELSLLVLQLEHVRVMIENAVRGKSRRGWEKEPVFAREELPELDLTRLADAMEALRQTLTEKCMPFVREDYPQLTSALQAHMRQVGFPLNEQIYQENLVAVTALMFLALNVRRSEKITGRVAQFLEQYPRRTAAVTPPEQTASSSPTATGVQLTPRSQEYNWAASRHDLAVTGLREGYAEYVSAEDALDVRRGRRMVCRHVEDYMRLLIDLRSDRKTLVEIWPDAASGEGMIPWAEIVRKREDDLKRMALQAEIAALNQRDISAERKRHIRREFEFIVGWVIAVHALEASMYRVIMDHDRERVDIARRNEIIGHLKDRRDRLRVDVLAEENQLNAALDRLQLQRDNDKTRA